MHVLLSLRNLVELIDANTVLRGHNGYWSEDELSDVFSVATTVDVKRFINNNQRNFFTKLN
jgi:hypothetical protein